MTPAVVHPSKLSSHEPVLTGEGGAKNILKISYLELFFRIKNNTRKPNVRGQNSDLRQHCECRGTTSMSV